jgi:chromosome segregation ATPase|tara:strand:- start:57 stop:623 length:567 start_codon:yes stop_codon:yes gene_type:complete
MNNSNTWTVDNAKTVFATLTKIANQQIELVDKSKVAESEPEDVVKALTDIVSDLEAVQESIPVEVAEVEEKIEEKVEIAEEEEDSKTIIEQLEAKVAELTEKLEEVSRESVASDYADLFDEPQVQQAKYDEVKSSSEGVSYWTAQIQAISSFKNDAGVSSYRPAKATSNWVKPLTKIAKTDSVEMRRL